MAGNKSFNKGLLGNPRMQMFLFMLTIAYVISPIDLIPDTIPILGWMDDIGVLLAQVVSFLIYIKRQRQAFHSENSNREDEK